MRSSAVRWPRLTRFSSISFFARSNPGKIVRKRRQTCVKVPKLGAGKDAKYYVGERLDRVRQRREEKYAELKMAALAELERRGYDVRGKTPGQIREILKRRPKRSQAPVLKKGGRSGMRP